MITEDNSSMLSRKPSPCPREESIDKLMSEGVGIMMNLKDSLELEFGLPMYLSI